MEIVWSVCRGDAILGNVLVFINYVFHSVIDVDAKFQTKGM